MLIALAFTFQRFTYQIQSFFYHCSIVLTHLRVCCFCVFLFRFRFAFAANCLLLPSPPFHHSFVRSSFRGRNAMRMMIMEGKRKATMSNIQSQIQLCIVCFVFYCDLASEIIHSEFNTDTQIHKHIYSQNETCVSMLRYDLNAFPF